MRNLIYSVTAFVVCLIGLLAFTTFESDANVIEPEVVLPAVPLIVKTEPEVGLGSS
jgi:hypothetical protein